MRALFTDERDGTLIAAEISIVTYDPPSKCLTFTTAEGNYEIEIPKIELAQANTISRSLYQIGMMDLTSYPARFV